MRLQIASDLHLEFPENRDYIALNPLQVAGDILLLAGDIVPLLHIERYRDFFDLMADNYKHTYWVPGNHEYYHFDIANKSSAFQESIRSNVTLLNNSTIELKNVHLHFTSLWSNISKTTAPYIERGLTDFHVIKCDGNRLSVEKYNQMHSESVAFLDTALNVEKSNQDNGIMNVVVTHHVPTFQHYPAKYLGSALNEAFATDLNEFVESSGADYISSSEISESLNRSMIARLISPNKKKVFKSALMRFIENGIGFVFPVHPGAKVRGIPTAHNAPILKEYFLSEENYVWPSANGKVRGQAITPLYPNQIKAVLIDEKLYNMLALIDAIRVGKVRERAKALELLNQFLGIEYE